MRNKQWVLTQADGLDQVLKWKARKIENYVEPAWGTEWPNDPPNWTNKSTPHEGVLRAVRSTSVRSNASLKVESRKSEVVERGAMVNGLAALTS
jgi:hypothetical protein